MQITIPASARLRARLYGPMEVYIRDGDGDAWKLLDNGRWQKERLSRLVFQRLVAAPHRRMDRWKLIDDLLSDKDDDRGNRDLTRAISIVRATIGEDLILTRDSVYELAGPDLIWVDADACQSLLVEAEGLGHIQALPLLEAALELLGHGEFLEGGDGTWVHGLRRTHERLLKRCRLWLAEAYEAQGRCLHAELQYEKLLQIEWLDEETQILCGLRLKAMGGQLRPLPVPVSTSLEIFSRQEDAIPDTLVEIIALTMRWPAHSPPTALQQIFSKIMKETDFMLVPETKIGRRHALQAIALLPIQLYGLRLFANEPLRLPPAEMLPYCAAGISACWELRKHQAEGMQAIQHILAAYLPALEKLAQQSSSSQDQAAQLAAQGYLLKSILAGNYCGNLDQDQAASRKARLYAQIAHHADLELVAMISLGNALGDEHLDAEALRIYQEAAMLPAFAVASPLLQGRVYMGLAGKYAICSQSNLAVSFLDRAREIYLPSPESDPCYASAFAGISSLAIWEGITLAHTHHYAEAIDAFSRFGSLAPLPGLLESTRAEHLINVASMATQQRDLDQASLYLDTAEDISQATGHKQRRREVCETLRCMQLLWPDEPRVRQLQEKILSR